MPDDTRDPRDLTPREGCPVHDWATDYDLMDEAYNKDPGPVWQDLRERCPIAHSTRWGGSWMPTKYEDVREMARDVPTLSNRSPGIIPPPPEMREMLIKEVKEFGAELPPISADAPVHRPFKQLVLPLFSPKAVEQYRPFTEQLAHKLIDRITGLGHGAWCCNHQYKERRRKITHELNSCSRWRARLRSWPSSWPTCGAHRGGR